MTTGISYQQGKSILSHEIIQYNDLVKVSFIRCTLNIIYAIFIGIIAN